MERVSEKSERGNLLTSSFPRIASVRGREVQLAFIGRHRAYLTFISLARQVRRSGLLGGTVRRRGARRGVRVAADVGGPLRERDRAHARAASRPRAPCGRRQLDCRGERNPIADDSAGRWPPNGAAPHLPAADERIADRGRVRRALEGCVTLNAINVQGGSARITRGGVRCVRFSGQVDAFDHGLGHVRMVNTDISR